MLLAIFIVGLLNSFMHARDAWARRLGAMPAGLIMSLIVAILAVAAVWISVSGDRIGTAA